MEIQHQLCHAHGSHLAVSDLLYKAPKEVLEELAEESDEEEKEGQEGEKEGEKGPEDGLNVDSDDESETTGLIEEMESQNPVLLSDIKPLIQKV